MRRTLSLLVLLPLLAACTPTQTAVDTGSTSSPAAMIASSASSVASTSIGSDWIESNGRYTHTTEPIFSFTYPSGIAFPVSKPGSVGTHPASMMTDQSCTNDGICVFLFWNKNDPQETEWHNGTVRTVNGHKTQEIVRFANEGTFDVLTEIRGDAWTINIIVSDEQSQKEEPDARLQAYSRQITESIVFGN